MTDFEKLTDFRNLYNAYLVSVKGCQSKHRADAFRYMALDNLIVMKQELVDRTYELDPYHDHIVKEPKQRLIMVGSFRDKVLQHSLCDNVIMPKMQHVFLLDNYAGQTGKGTLFGLDRLSEQLHNYYDRYGCDGYILKCDISKFYYSIPHDAVKRCLFQWFEDDGIRWICEKIIDSVPDPGLPLGNQSSQVFALVLLHELDVLIKEELHCDFYGRYVDDFFLISPDKEFLKSCLRRIEEYLGSIGLSLNHKTEIVPIKKGIRFLGFHVYLTDDGHVIRLLDGKNKRKEKKRLRRDAQLVLSGKMTVGKYHEKYQSWRNHASHGNCWRLIHSMDKYEADLIKEYSEVPIWDIIPTTH